MSDDRAASFCREFVLPGFESKALDALDALIAATISASSRREAVLREALARYAYKQGTDSNGWFRQCNLCGEESRLPTNIEPIGEFPHSVACVLSRST